MMDGTLADRATGEATRDELQRIAAAIEIAAVAPETLGGVWLRARSGPAREGLLAALIAGQTDVQRIHQATDRSALVGGLDVAATLAEGRSIMRKGVLERPCTLVLAMAERCERETAALIARALDAGLHTLIALDEGDAEEAPPPSLTDRMAVFIAPDEGLWREIRQIRPDLARIDAARKRLPEIEDGPAARLLVETAAILGVSGTRGPMLALRVARVAAALAGHSRVEEEDVSLAAQLCLAHRATTLPETEPAETQPPPDQPPQEGGSPPEAERVVEAARAALPPGVLAALIAGRQRSAHGAGAGASRKGARKGRPLPSRPGRIGGRARIDPVATLAAAAPWQALRGRCAPGVVIRSEDIRLRRYRERADRLLIFLVDASGSAAAARLAEAKGAVELLLAGAYASRDHVALISFRGRSAEVVLPPTRSLSLTKKRLAGVPGGGGTPLAAALSAADDLARQAAKRGMTPALVLLTDGRANIALDGAAGRPQAQEDALRLARAVSDTGMAAVAIDTGRRPDPWLAELAQAMGARYMALPRADAAAVSTAVTAALPR